MCIKRHFITIILALIGIVSTYAQQNPLPKPMVEDTIFVSRDIDPQSMVIYLATPRETTVSESWQRHIHLKTNAVGWGMLIANMAAEVDLAKHWSFTLPVYYSALNYFTSDVKFRTLCFQPEVRYWFCEDNQGWFAGAHFGLAWFNYAKGGEWRYQDRKGRTPLIGGGISGGYRMPITKNHKWWMEFALGAGAYKLHYDIFHNEHNGQRVDTRKRTFFGIDQVAVSFAYRFDLKKGGKR